MTLTVILSLRGGSHTIIELGCLHAPLPCLLLCRLHCKGLQLGADVDLPALAASCFGYSGADLAALVREAAMHAFSTAAAQLLDTGGGEATVHVVVCCLPSQTRLHRCWCCVPLWCCPLPLLGDCTPFTVGSTSYVTVHRISTQGHKLQQRQHHNQQQQQQQLVKPPTLRRVW